MDVTHTTAAPSEIEADLLAIGIRDDLAAELKAALGDYGADLAAFLTAQRYEPKAGATKTIPALGRVQARQIVVVGLGDLGAADLAKAAGCVGQIARGERATTVALAFGELTTEQLQDVLEYVPVGNYAYDTHLPEKQRKPAIARLTLLGADPSGVASGAAIRAKYQALARDLVNAPADEIYPQSLAAKAQELSQIPGVSVTVWDLHRCKKEGLVGVEAVGRASRHPGVMIHVSYTPENAKEHVALVGKGVTFDAGGLSLKPSNAMQTMRCDMGGAATTLAAVGCIAELGLPIAVDAFVPSVENMVDGASFKLGDILHYRNGVTVEIHNTDAEGRLILADALILASEIEGVTRIVDMATLTGAIIISLGQDYTGLFTDDDALAQELLDGSDRAGEKMWRMPLDKAYNRLLKGTWGQIKNVGGREAGSITAALFLQHFVADDKRWAHLDIAGTAFADSAVAPYVKGGTGQVVRALVNWADSLTK